MMRKEHFMKEKIEFHVVVMDVVDQEVTVLHQEEDGVKDQMMDKPRVGVLIPKQLDQMDSTKTMDLSQSNTNIKNEIQFYDYFFSFLKIRIKCPQKIGVSFNKIVVDDQVKKN